jgi:hypothetical protein
MDVSLVRRRGRWIFAVHIDLGDGDQRQAQVAHFLEQAMEGGLIDHEARDDRDAVFLSEVQVVEPGGPARAEMALQTDLVLSRLETSAGR